MRRAIWIGLGLIFFAGLALAGMVVMIRTGLQNYSDAAIARFPGDRTSALIQVVECETCPLRERDHAVWALGQMAEVRAEPALRKYCDGRDCNHEARLCQSELRKALRMIGTREERTGPLSTFVRGLHRPWN